MDSQWTASLGGGDGKHITCVGNQDTAVFAAQNGALKHSDT